MPLKTQFDEIPSLNLTSMIDVLFLLIIFFMVATTFNDFEQQLAVHVPRVNDAGPLTPAPARRTVNVHQDGHITLDRTDVDLQQLQSALAAAREEYADLGVVVRGDAEVDFQHVASVLNACRQAGIAELGISVRLAANPEEIR